MINIRCFYCEKEAQAKIGESKGNILNALLGKKCWSKIERYVCKNHYILLTNKVPKVNYIKEVRE